MRKEEHRSSCTGATYAGNDRTASGMRFEQPRLHTFAAQNLVQVPREG